MTKIPTQKTFRFVHANIVTRVDQIRQCGRLPERAWPLVAEFYMVLLDYVHLQAKPVYRDLEAQHCENREILKILEFLEHDIAELAVDILQFYERFSQSSSPVRKRSFSMEFLQFSGRIIQRLEMEEERLIPLLPL